METLNLKFLEELNQLSQSEDLIQIGKELSELRQSFEDYMLEEERKEQIRILEARDRGEELDVDENIANLKAEFYAAYDELKTRRKEQVALKNALESENLKNKRALLKELAELVANEEHIGKLFEEQKRINEAWKAIGDIPRDVRGDVQQEYSRLLDDFFHNVKIYKEIKDYDRKKNGELKRAIVQKLELLINEESIKEVEAQLKSLQDEWEDIGPTEQEEWEALKESYWAAVKAVYEKIKNHYEGRRAQMQENIQKKLELVEKVQTILEQNRASVADWSNHTDVVLQLQEEWKTIGFGPKKENEEVWKQFRAHCDAFFEAKGVFFSELNSVFDAVAEKKKALIDEAEAIKNDTDWGPATQKFIQLQKKWKSLGSAGQKYEQKLWKKFRAICDYFFEAKQAHFEQLDKENEGNYTEKMALIEEIKTFEVPSDSNDAIAALKGFAERFNAIGHVPLKHKDEVYRAFQSALDTHYKALKIEGSQRERVLFESKISTMQGQSNAAEMFAKEKAQIRKQIDEVKQQLMQYENNLGFFSNAKSNSPLLDEVKKNIERAKARLTELKDKLKLIPNE
jgi:predicted DNA-binding protein YlxM (UPF0122 family)